MITLVYTLAIVRIVAIQRYRPLHNEVLSFQSSNQVTMWADNCRCRWHHVTRLVWLVLSGSFILHNNLFSFVMNIIQYYSFVVIFTMFKGGGALLRWLLVGDLTFWIQQGGKLQTECTPMLERFDFEGTKLPNMPNMPNITNILFCFHWTLGVAIRPADVARIKKDQEGLFWYRVDIERTDHFDFSYFQVPSHVPARGVPRQQKEREDLADGVTAMPACETYELLPLCMYLMYFILKSRRCYTRCIRCIRCAFVAFVVFASSFLCSRKSSRRCECQAMISPADILLVSFCLILSQECPTFDSLMMFNDVCCVKQSLWESEVCMKGIHGNPSFAWPIKDRIGKAMSGPLWDWPFEDHACGRMPGSHESHRKPTEGSGMLWV